MKKAIVYCRFSSAHQRDESIEAQIRAIKEYTEKNDIEIVKVYADKAESGTTDNRTEFQSMFNFLEQSNNSLNINYVIVHKLDRFTRNRYDSAVYKRKLKLVGVKLISVLERLDDSPESVILESTIEAFAEYYSKNLAREVMKGMSENAYKAKFNGGIPPYGYCIDNDKNYVLDKYEAQVVKYIFDSYINEQGYKQIINNLNLKGHKTRKGNNFNQSAIHSILKNEKYCGMYTFNKTHNEKNLNGKKVFRKNTDKEMIKIEDSIPSIISKETFYKVQKKLKNNKRMSQSFKANRVYLLSGKITCGECGATLCGSTRKGGKNGKYIYISYYCPNKRQKTCSCKEIKAENIENTVLNYIQNKIFSENNITNMLKDIENKIKELKNENSDNIKIFEKELLETESKINNIVQAVTDGLYNPTMKDKMTELENKKNELIVMIEEEKNKKTSFSPDMIKKYFNLGKNLKDLKPDQQKKFIETFIKKIVIQKDNYIKILFKYYECTLSSGRGIDYVVTYKLRLKTSA